MGEWNLGQCHIILHQMFSEITLHSFFNATHQRDDNNSCSLCSVCTWLVQIVYLVYLCSGEKTLQDRQITNGAQLNPVYTTCWHSVEYCLFTNWPGENCTNLWMLEPFITWCILLWSGQQGFFCKMFLNHIHQWFSSFSFFTTLINSS